MYRRTIFLISAVILSLVSASCAARRHGAQDADQALPPQTGAYPAECKGQEPGRLPMLHDGPVTAIKCYCVVGDQAFTWWKAVTPDEDPAGICLNPMNVLQEPAQYLANAGYVQGQTSIATSQTTAPAQSSTVPSIPPMPTILPIPLASTTPPAASALPVLPPPTASVAPPKSEPKKFAMYTRDVKYECSEGIAKRSYNLVVSENQNGRVEQSVTQECHGNVACLVNEADQQDPAKPPCACPSNKPPAKVNQQFNIWTCK